MAIGAPAFGSFGKGRKVKLRELKAGMMVLDPIIGRAGNVLVHEGEVLSQKHVDFVLKLCDAKGEACLLNYTREVQARACLGSGDERPKCDFDPYAALSIQKHYKAGTALRPARLVRPGGARKIYTMADMKEQGARDVRELAVVSWLHQALAGDKALGRSDANFAEPPSAVVRAAMPDLQARGVKAWVGSGNLVLADLSVPKPLVLQRRPLAQRYIEIVPAVIE